MYNERFIREHYENKEAWLKGRSKGNGASDIGSILEVNPWKSKLELWEEKTGRRQPKDLSNVEAVQRGIREEPIIRAAFIADHPEFVVEHYPYDILKLKTHPYIQASLDGELLYMGGNPSFERRYGIEPGMRGVLEIKTGSYSTPRYLSEWQGDAVPRHYFPQVCQQLLVTGWDFAWIQAKLFRTDSKYARGGDNSFLPQSYETFFIVTANSPVVQTSFDTIIDAQVDFQSCVDHDRMPWTSIPNKNRI